MTAKKVVLITGCSDGGLGSALAIAFHQTGQYRVIATARTLSKLKETRALGIEDLELDVLSQSSISACAQSLSALTSGRLDILVNNAGAGYNMPVLDIDLDEARKVFELNVFSLITVTRAFTPLLLKTPHAKVVNNISVAAYVCLPVQGTYNASKAAANSMTENLRLELKPFGVQVIALITGSVKSNFFKNVPQAGDQTSAQLPDDSIYRVVPGGLKIMRESEAILMTDSVDASTWAKQVVGDLSKSKPPHQIWRGTSAGLLRYGCLLPVGTFDAKLMKLSTLGELENALAAGR